MDILDEIKSRAHASATARQDGDGSEFAYSCPDDGAEPEYYTPGELADMLQIPLRTLEKWIWQKRLPVVKCGRLNRFPVVEIQKRLLSGNLLK